MAETVEELLARAKRVEELCGMLESLKNADPCRVGVLLRFSEANTAKDILPAEMLKRVIVLGVLACREEAETELDDLLSG